MHKRFQIGIYRLLQFSEALAVAGILVFFSQCTGQQKIADNPPTLQVSTSPLPEVRREFRAAWVATVANINWPSQPGLSTDRQQDEAIRLLDFLQAHHFNAVIFQVRPQADALYQSDLEPWSYFLTGKQGQAPDPYYDPLQFWVRAAHQRGLELHVWLNPYRAHHVSGGPVTDSSVVKKMPGLVHRLQEGYWWFDPSLKATRDHGLHVIRDIVKRYDIDGVHFDDYFYPYPSYNGNADFPDSSSWNQYLKNGGRLTRSDWRREAVNQFIEQVYKVIKTEKKQVRFGLSPFGIWRPGHPAAVTGFDQYEQLYADAKYWLNQGWVDYFSPQLYWPIDRQGQSFPVLLGWWSTENTHHRHLWPGISIGRDSSKANIREVINKIMITRGMLPQSPGLVHWSISSLTRNPPLARALLEGPYQQQALVPASTWLDPDPPAAPALKISRKDDSLRISWTDSQPADVFHRVLYYQYGDQWQYRIFNNGEQQVTIALEQSGRQLVQLAGSSVDRCGNESAKTIIAAGVATKPAILPRSSWQAATARPYKPQQPVRITIHHEGGRVLADTANAALRLKNLQAWCMGPDRNWTDIPYHFLIAPDGTIFEGRDPATVGETYTEYDPEGHLLICLLGNYEKQELGPAARNSLARLIAYCCQQYGIDPGSIACHRDYCKNTDCPGKNIYPYVKDGTLLQHVRALMARGD
ncbi:hypothetical protein GCM10027051_04300 [Niabella terrae]